MILQQIGEVVVVLICCGLGFGTAAVVSKAFRLKNYAKITDPLEPSWKGWMVVGSFAVSTIVYILVIGWLIR